VGVTGIEPVTLPCEGSAGLPHTYAAPHVAAHQCRSTTLPNRGHVVLRVALPGMVSGRLLANAGRGAQGLVRLDELFGSRTGQLLTAWAPAPGGGWP
jgi:hypothetical protein